jgi:hypothetical protein
MSQQVQFIHLSQSEYDTLGSKNARQLYFTSDTHRIYRGDEIYANPIFDVTGSIDLSEYPEASVSVEQSLEDAIAAAENGLPVRCTLVCTGKDTDLIGLAELSHPGNGQVMGLEFHWNLNNSWFSGNGMT